MGSKKITEQDAFLSDAVRQLIDLSGKYAKYDSELAQIVEYAKKAHADHSAQFFLEMESNRPLSQADVLDEVVVRS